MTVLWNTEKALSASDIERNDPSLNKNTIQAVLRKLLKYQLIAVDDIGYSGTVLTRLFRPTIAQEEFVTSQLSSFSMKSLVSNFIETNDDEVVLDELEQMIQRKKDELNEGK